MTAGTPPRRIARRALLLSGLTGAALAACAEPDAAPAAPGPSAAPTTEPPAPSPTPSPEPAPTPTLPTVPAYTVLAGEVEPEVKLAAVQFVEAALTVPATERSAVEGLGDRVLAAGQAPAVAAPLASLLPSEGPSVVRVVYPQYGGLAPGVDRASVMVVADRSFLGMSAGGVREVVTQSLTVDVRLDRAEPRWVVTEVLPAARPAAGAPISAVAQSLLADARIRLPGAARDDVLAGSVDDRVLLALTAMAQRWTVDVTVLASGHPPNVFGTDRLSNHTLGRAVDVWALDGVPVIDHARAPWKEAMDLAAASGADEIGGPVDPGAGPFFSDAVHQDHLHIGFELEAPAGG